MVGMCGEEKYNCGDKISLQKSINKLDIKMSEIYSLSSLGSRKVRDYLSSFSHTRMKSEDDFFVQNQFKQKCGKKYKIHQITKPYNRTPSYGKFNETTSSKYCFVKPHSKLYCSMVEKNEEEDNSSNCKTLKIRKANGTMEINFKKVVLMRVKEIPKDMTLDQESEKLSNGNVSEVSSTTLTNGLNSYSKFSRKSFNLNNCGSQYNSNPNILRVKSSSNCTDLSSERKRCLDVHMDKKVSALPITLRKPHIMQYYNDGNYSQSKKNSLNFCPCSRCHYGDKNVIPASNSSLNYVHEKFNKNEGIMRTPSNKYVYTDQRRERSSVQTIFHPSSHSLQFSVPIGQFQGKIHKEMDENQVKVITDMSF